MERRPASAKRPRKRSKVSDEGKLFAEHEPDIAFRPMVNGWPLNRKDIKLTPDRNSITGKRCICVTMPEFMFTEGRMQFKDLNIRTPREEAISCFFAAGVQLIFYALNVVYNRINSPESSWEKYPLMVFVEGVTSEADPAEVVEYRLWIVEKNSEELDFGSVFAEAWSNVNSILQKDGTFKKADEKHNIDTPPADAGPPKNKYSVYELYKRICDKEALLTLCSVLAGRSVTAEMREALCTDLPLNDSGHILHVGNQFHPRNAFRCYSKRANRDQIDLSRYGSFDSGRVLLHFPVLSTVYQVIPKFWKVYTFMSRIFPDHQENELDLNWKTHMRHIASRAREIRTKEKEDAAAELNEKRRYIYGEPEPSVADHDVQSAMSNPFAPEQDDVEYRPLSHNDIGMEPVDRDGIFNGTGVNGGGIRLDLSLYEPGTLRTLSPDEAAEYGMLVELGDLEQLDRRGMFLGDALEEFQREVTEHHGLINIVFKNDEVARNREINSLKDYVFERFDRDFTKNTLVSKTQVLLNSYFTEHGLADMHFELPSSDPTLSVLDNWYKYMLDGAGYYERINSNQMLFYFIYVNGENIFDRSPTVHNNIYAGGVNSAGKTYTFNAVIENLLPSTVTKVTSTARQSKAYDNVDSDVCKYNEDMSMSKDFQSGDGADAEKRYEMSAQEIVRHRLEKVEENGRQTWKMVRVRNVCPTLYMDVGNEDESEIATNLGTSKDALFSRYIRLTFSKHNSRIRPLGENIPKPSGADRFRKLNIKFHCIRGWFSKIAYVLDCIGLVDMKVFDVCMPILSEALRSTGIMNGNTNNRKDGMMRNFCRSLVVTEQYLIHHCVETGMYFGQKFKAKMMRTWVPCCTLNHVIHAFGYFYENYIPVALPYAVEFLRDRIFKCINDPSKHIVFQGKPVEHPQYNMSNFAGAANNMQNMLKQMSNANQNGYGSNLNNGGQNAFFVPPTGNQVMGGPAPIGTGNNMSHMNNNNINNQGNQNAVAGQEEYDGTFVLFKYETLESLSRAIHVRSTTSNTVFSIPSIVKALQTLRDLSVFSYKYVFLSKNVDFPDRKSNEKKRFREAGLKIGKNGILVNYGLVAEKGIYNDLFGHCMKMLCYENTIKQDYLTGIPHPKFPWIPKRISLKPRPGRKMIIRNSAFVTRTSLVNLFFHDDRSQMDSERNTLFSAINIDIDTHYLVEALKRHFPVGDLTLMDIAKWSPRQVQIELAEYYALCRENGVGKYKFLEYPKYALQELERIDANTKRNLKGKGTHDDAIVNHNLRIGGTSKLITSLDIQKHMQNIHRTTSKLKDIGTSLFSIDEETAPHVPKVAQIIGPNRPMLPSGGSDANDDGAGMGMSQALVNNDNVDVQADAARKRATILDHLKNIRDRSVPLLQAINSGVHDLAEIGNNSNNNNDDSSSENSHSSDGSGQRDGNSSQISRGSNQSGDSEKGSEMDKMSFMDLVINDLDNKSSSSHPSRVVACDEDEDVFD